MINFYFKSTKSFFGFFIFFNFLGIAHLTAQTDTTILRIGGSFTQVTNAGRSASIAGFGMAIEKPIKKRTTFNIYAAFNRHKVQGMTQMYHENLLNIGVQLRAFSKRYYQGLYFGPDLTYHYLNEIYKTGKEGTSLFSINFIAGYYVKLPKNFFLNIGSGVGLLFPFKKEINPTPIWRIEAQIGIKIGEPKPQTNPQ